MSHGRVRLAAFACLLALLTALAPAPPTSAAPTGATYDVTRTDDPTPSGGCPPGNCSLREAVLAANSNPGHDTIRLKHLTTYVLSIAPTGPDDASSGDLDLVDSVDFAYSDTCLLFLNCNAVIRGGPGWNDRIFHIGNSAAASFGPLSIEYGHTSVGGGGIHVEAGSTLTLTGSTVMSNTAGTDGGGVYNLGNLTVQGGAILANNHALGSGGGLLSASGSRLAVYQSTVHDNLADVSGGGLAAFDSTVISETTVTANTAAHDSGGGLYFGGSAPATVVDSSFGSNGTGPSVDVTHRGIGGAILDVSGPLHVLRTVVAYNHAGCGGGIGTWLAAQVRVDSSAFVANAAVIDGGGICAGDFFQTAQITVTNSTLSLNQTQGSGGGIAGGQVSLYSDTIAQNTADSDHSGVGDGGGLLISGGGQFNMANSILAGNIDTGSQAPECSGNVLHSLGHNLIQGIMTCTLDGDTTGNKPGQDPLLDAPADNGGSTFTQALLVGSPAINAGDPAGCPDGAGALLSTDQRGFGRWGRCDMGAFEYQPAIHLFLALLRR